MHVKRGSFFVPGLSDFQYLPMVKNVDGTYSSISDDVTVTKLQPAAWFDKPAPLYLPPPIFFTSRPTDKLLVSRTSKTT